MTKKLLTYLDLPRLLADGAHYGMTMSVLYMKDRNNRLWQIVEDYPFDIKLLFREPADEGSGVGTLRVMREDEYITLFEGTQPTIYEEG